MSPVKSPEQHSVRDVGKKNKFVVENDEADELPPGWTKELKTRKSGSITKVDRRYTDPVTGYIFHSLKDVQRYLKTGEVGRLATKPKNNECVDTDNKDERLHMEELERSESKDSETLRRKRSLDNEDERLHMEEREERSESKEQHSARDVGKTNKIVAENDEADELPPGWTKELKTRKSGSRTKFDRNYTDPVTGYTFCSLKDAQRYVKTGVLGRLARKPKNNEDEKLHFVVENDETDELPPEWTKEVKTRKIGSKTKVDRRYTDPVTGYIFHSLKDVQRYLKTGEVGRLATKPKNNECVDPDNKDERLHFVVENDKADELPPGWTKELNTRKTGSKTKVDRHYTDPVTGYIFRSLKDAQRYVKTGEVGRLATKPKNNECVDTDNKDERLHIVAENDEADELPPGWTKELKTRKSGSRTKFDRHYTDPVTGYIFCSLKEAQRYVKTGVLGRLARKPKNNEDEKLHIEERSKSKDSETLRRKRPLDNTGTEFSVTGKSEMIHHASKTRQAKHLSSIVDNASPASLPPAKTRRATRQAGIEINAPPPSLPDTRTGRQATRARLVNLASPKKTEAEKMTDKHNQENHGNPKEHNNRIEMGPATFPPMYFEKKELPVVNATVSNPMPQAGYGYGGNMKSSDSSINFSMNDLWTDPCIEFAVKTLTGAIPCEDLNKPENPAPSPLKVPLEDLWTDPCIEFAVKTLTGAIPVGENDRLQQQTDTSRNTRAPHDFYLPDVGPTGQNKQQQQQQQGATFGNVGFQNSGNFVNGQCSRSRFF